MKKLLLTLSIFAGSFLIAICQEFADLNITNPNEGTGSFNDATLPDFTWKVTGSLNQNVEIKNSEVFDDVNIFETRFGQANNVENIRVQVVPNGNGTDGQEITSRADLTISFDKFAPANCWGFCLVDIDVENALISATDRSGEQIPDSIINSWLAELFDANKSSDGLNIPKWDPINAALLGSDTDEGYVTYKNKVIGGMPSSEAPSAYFAPNIPIKTLTVTFENLQENYATSFHFFIASEDFMTFISDSCFEQALIDKGYDTGAIDHLVQTSNINKVQSLWVNGKNISDLTGIEAFSALKDLRCHINNITELDVSKNALLEVLSVDVNQLTGLDVSNNPLLRSLSFPDNQISEINVAGNPKLFSLNFDNNQISAIDLSNNPKLEVFYARNNNLSDLDIRSNPLLDYLVVPGNQLSGLDLSANPNIVELKCENNQITNLNLQDKNLLKLLTCQNNLLTNLDISENTLLEHFNCAYNQLSTIDFSNNNKIIYANCAHNNLNSFNILEGNDFLYFDCSWNNLPTIDLKNNPSLDYLDCSNNQLTGLELSGVTNLHVLYCDSNQIRSLDLGLNDTLYLLDCNNNQLEELNIKNGKNYLLTGESTPLYPMYFDPDPMMDARFNPSLTCIQVDSEDGSYAYSDWFIDDWAIFQEDCSVGIDASLSEINVNGISIDGFHPDSLEYVFPVSSEFIGIPKLDAIPNDPAAEVSITQATEVPGVATITVTAEDGTTIKTYTVNFTFITGSTNFQLGNVLNIYPNPATNQLKIDLSAKLKPFKVTITDMNGNCVFSGFIDSSDVLDTSKLSSGTYSILIKNEDVSFNGRFSKM